MGSEEVQLPTDLSIGGDVPKATILIVEDNDSNRYFVERALQRGGYRTLSAENGETALDLLREQNVDLVLMDLHMPGISGLDVMRQWREHEEQTNTGPLPFIVLTADAQESTRVECMKAGVQTLLTKPIAIKEVERVLKEFLPYSSRTQPN